MHQRVIFRLEGLHETHGVTDEGMLLGGSLPAIGHEDVRFGRSVGESLSGFLDQKVITGSARGKQQRPLG